jgi:hypothetical protein
VNDAETREVDDYVKAVWLTRGALGPLGRERAQAKRAACTTGVWWAERDARYFLSSFFISFFICIYIFRKI